MTTNTRLFVGRIFTTDLQDNFRILIGEMEVTELVNRTAGWAYFTVINGEFVAASTGRKLLQTISDINGDDPGYRPNAHSKEVTNYLEAFWNTALHQVEDESETTVVLVQSLMAENLRVWHDMCEYAESTYDHGKIFGYLDNNTFIEGDMYPIMSDWDVTEMRDRAEAYESDRNIALSRLMNHYFAIAYRLHSLGAEPNDVAHAVAAFLEYLDRYNDDN